MQRYRFFEYSALFYILAAMAGCGLPSAWHGETQYRPQANSGMAAVETIPTAETSAEEQTTAQDYTVSRNNMDRVYQKLAARMTLKQQLALSSEQTAWLNTRDLGCIQSNVDTNRCKFIMTQTRTAVLKNSLSVYEKAASHQDMITVAVAVPKVITQRSVKAVPLAVASPPPLTPIPDAVPRSVTLNVAATAMPWIWNSEGINSPYAFGYPDGTPPAAVKLDQLGTRPGGHIMIKYITGKITLGPGTPATDALGYTKLDAPNDAGPAGKYPSAYIPLGTASLGALVGVFTKADGSIVGAPFTVGDGLAMVAVPPGANRLQLGINDDIYGAEDPGNGNAGAFSVQVSAD